MNTDWTRREYELDERPHRAPRPFPIRLGLYYQRSSRPLAQPFPPICLVWPRTLEEVQATLSIVSCSIHLENVCERRLTVTTESLVIWLTLDVGHVPKIVEPVQYKVVPTILDWDRRNSLRDGTGFGIEECHHQSNVP